MEEMQFDCEWVTNKQFAIWRRYYENKTVHGPMDYLYCTRRDPRGMGYRTYEVGFPYANGSVTNILVNVKDWGIGDL